jgi:hypothetical protein
MPSSITIRFFAMIKTPSCVKGNAANRINYQQSYNHLFWQNQPKQTRAPIR